MSRDQEWQRLEEDRRQELKEDRARWVEDFRSRIVGVGDEVERVLLLVDSATSVDYISDQVSVDWALISALWPTMPMVEEESRLAEAPCDDHLVETWFLDHEPSGRRSLDVRRAGLLSLRSLRIDGWWFREGSTRQTTRTPKTQFSIGLLADGRRVFDGPGRTMTVVPPTQSREGLNLTALARMARLVDLPVLPPAPGVLADRPSLR